MAEEIRIPFNTENAKHWGYISDRTMGGISDGQAFLDQDQDIKSTDALLEEAMVKVMADPENVDIDTESYEEIRSLALELDDE